MLYLLVVSLIWAFSFGLIKTNLTSIDSDFVAAARLGISLLVFLPFFRPRAVPDRRTALRLVLAGAIQYGGMYVAYLYAFQLLQAYEVALFTVFTPLYVTLLNDLYHRRLRWVSLGAALLAVAGAWVVKGGAVLQPGLLAGFLIVQVSNLCFAFGQIYYRQILDGHTVRDLPIFALPYLGGVLASGLSALFFTDWSTLVVTPPQWLTLLFLGAVSSGLCFFLWNVGARRVNAGALAVFNNLKLPLAVAVSLIFFGERVALPPLLIGGGMALAALLWNEWDAKRRPAPAPAVAAHD